MFTKVLFTMAKIWKQPTCPLVSEQINKLWYIHAKKYSSLKGNELPSHEKTWGKQMCITR